MSAALRTALREACAELRHRNADWQNDGGKWTPTEWIAAWERLADEAELNEIAQEPMTELTDEALATMLEAEIAALQEVHEQREPAGGAGGAGGTAAPEAMPGSMPKWKRPESTSTSEGIPPPEPSESREAWLERVTVATKFRRSAEQALEQAWDDYDREGFDRLQASLVAPGHLPGDPPVDGIPWLEQIERIIRAQYEPSLAPQPTHAMLCCARLGSVWCTEPDGHPPPCKGPEEREVAGNDFGPRRKR